MSPEVASGRAALRRVGVVVLVLAALSLLGTVTGWEAHGSTGRTVLAVVGVVLLLLGMTLVRSRAVRVAAVVVDRHGLTFHFDGSSRDGVRDNGLRSGDVRDSVSWAELSAVRLRVLGADRSTRGYLLSLDGDVGLAQRHPDLAASTRASRNGGSTVTVGVDRVTGEQLAQHLPQFAGERYRPSPRLAL